MYTILVTNENELITSVAERIMQRSKLVDSLHFLVEPTYKGLDMSGFTVLMEYFLPVSKEYKMEVLKRSDELYKGKLEYILPFDTSLTAEAGQVKLSLSFSRLDMDPDGNYVEQVRNTDETFINIIPVSAWSNYIPDDILDPVVQLILSNQAVANSLADSSKILSQEKADNLVLDKDKKVLQLESQGKRIGSPVNLEPLGNEIAEATKAGLVRVII